MYHTQNTFKSVSSILLPGKIRPANKVFWGCI